MAFHYWYLAVVVVVAALVGWGLVVTRLKALFGAAVALLIFSGLTLYTLVLDEPNLVHDLNSRIDVLAFIGIPAVVAIGILVAVKRAGSRRT